MIAFTDGGALIVAIPSQTQNGVYLVQVEPTGDQLIISHNCPAVQFGNECKHISKAVKAYERWQWWEPKKKVVLHPKKIVLQPNWQLVQLPLSPEERIRELIANAS